MDIDYGRKFDLEEIYLQIKQAKSSDEKKHWEKLFQRVLNESRATGKLRENLIRAVRGNDRRAVRYYSQKLENLQQEQYGGHYFQKSPRED